VRDEKEADGDVGRRGGGAGLIGWARRGRSGRHGGGAGASRTIGYPHLHPYKPV
jgi:hypothetical protein